MTAELVWPDFYTVIIVDAEQLVDFLDSLFHIIKTPEDHLLASNGLFNRLWQDAFLWLVRTEIK